MTPTNSTPPTKDILQQLDLGSSVAEFDESLEKYFIENEAFRSLVSGKKDIVAGDKGTGKTAVYRVLQERYSTIPELKGVEVVKGFNPTGNPIFQKLVQQRVMTEGQYASVWKAYFLSLVGNWVLELAGEKYSANFEELHNILSATDLRSKDEKPETIFSKITNAIQRFLNPTSASMEMTFSETGIPIVTPKITFEGERGVTAPREVPHEKALAVLNKCLDEIDLTVWVVLDRLDEAFQGFPDIERPALRALLRTYLDLLEFKRVQLKLFLRRDLFKKVIGDGFVNLTHINAKKIEIVWDIPDLLNLLARRIRDNEAFIESLGAGGLNDEALFYRLFPPKIDQAERKPTTLNWMMSRIRDGKDVKPPRNLIDLANLANEEQVRADGRSPRKFEEGSVVLITSDAVRRAHERLSEQRVQDTLLAEAGPQIAALIERFRKAKAEHNKETLKELLGLEGEALQAATRQLVEVGFLEEFEGKGTWKVPMLYRDGLDVKQGKAFAADQTDEDE